MNETNTVDRLISLGILSGAGLLLEISLTRLISAIYFPPFVFAVLALAILGIGLGAALASWAENIRQARLLPVYIASIGMAAVALLIAILFTLVTASLFAMVLLLTMPYFFTGLALTTLFSSDSRNSPTLYMADLLGAGSGVVLAVPVMNAVGPVNSIVVAATLFGVAAYIIHPRNFPPLPVGLVLVALALLGANLTKDWLTLNVSAIDPDKPMTDVLIQSDGELLETRWDAFARTDLVQPAGDDPRRLYMDGGAGSIMPPAGNDRTSLTSDIGFFPFATDQPQRILVIGPGGGLDVWFGLQINAQEVVAVEVNPASVDIVQDYNSYNGGLYSNPRVQIIVDEGRSVLQRDQSQYDLIYLSQVVTLTAERTGFALTENTIYTVEAFSEYWSHLTPKGVVAVKLYDEITAERALSTVLATLEMQGISNQTALQHILVLADPKHDPPIPLLMVRKQPYSHDDSLVYGRILRDLNFMPLFLPNLWMQPPLDSIWDGTRTFADVVNNSSVDISPTTDDSPFFYQFDRGMPDNLKSLWGILSIVTLISILFVIYIQRNARSGHVRFSPLYFAGLGIGFIMVEVTVIQQTRIFLGHPTLAVTTALGTILVGGGLGSGMAGQWLRERLPLHVINAAIIGLILIWVALWPIIGQRMLGAGLALRIVIVILCLSPLTLCMGMPFSMGLWRVGTVDEQQVALAWAVNGLMTVVGTAAAVTLAIIFGFSFVLLVGVGAYIVSAVTAYFVFEIESAVAVPS